MELDLINKMTQFTIKKNHTERWGVLVGRHSATFVFMHKDKEECLKHIRDNYKTYFK